jgi:hypothetical protein
MQNQNANTAAVVSSTNAAAAAQNDSIAPATIAVGSTDKVHAAPAVSAAVAPADVRTRIAALIAERKVWQLGAFAKSNAELYALLGKCYAFYFDLRGNDKDAKAAREVLNAEMAAKAYRFNEGTHTLTRLVKYVFEGVDRRRVSAYSLVLREALAQGIKADGIPAFITQGKGVEEIRRSKSKTAKTPKQKAELGKQAVGGEQLAVVSGGKLAEKIDIANVGNDLVAIVTQQADGSLIVRALVRSQSVLNAALACAYSASKVVVETDNANKEAANDDKAQGALIAAAAAA